MVCPVCGIALNEGTTVCPQCGSPVNTTPMPTTPMGTDPMAMNTPMPTNPMVANNPMPMNQAPMNAPMDMNQNISVPSDFKFAGGNTDPNEELPDGLASLLGMKDEEKAPVPKKKKRRRRLMKTIALMIVFAIVFVLVFLFVVGLMPETVSYDLVCTRTDTINGRKAEFEYKFSDQGGFFNSDNKIIISNVDGSNLTLEDKENLEKEMGNLGFDQQSELSNGKLIVTYSNSHYNVATVDQVRAEAEKSGSKCK